MLIITFVFFGNISIFSSTFCNEDSLFTSKIKLLRHYADNYNPKSILTEDTVNVAMPPLPDTLISNTINYIWVRDSSEVEKCIVVILLKLYKSHLICCKQSYDIRPNGEYNNISNPIFYYFTRLAGLCDLSKGDMIDYINCGPITSSEIYDYVFANKRLLKYKPILKEYNHITDIINKSR